MDQPTRHQAVTDDVDDPGNHTPVVDAWDAPRFVWQQRLKTGKLAIRKPEVVVGHVKLPTFGALKHISIRMGISFMDPEPRIKQTFASTEI